MHYTIHRKEKKLFYIMACIGIAFYAFMLTGTIPLDSIKWIAGYTLFLVVLSYMAHVFMIGYLRGNAIKVNEQQFPDIYNILKNQSEQLQLRTIPTMYILQGNGMLNAFATRFARRNYVVLYSDVLSAAYQEGRPAVEFIMGHELGHIKRNHVSLWKRLVTLPSHFIPFLNSAYSRACEYTCDNIGYNLCPEGAQNGLLILGAGKDLYKSVNVYALIENAKSEKGFPTWIAEKVSSHPHLIKRIEALNIVHRLNTMQAATTEQCKISDAPNKQQEIPH